MLMLKIYELSIKKCLLNKDGIAWKQNLVNFMNVVLDNFEVRPPFRYLRHLIVESVLLCSHPDTVLPNTIA